MFFAYPVPSPGRSGVGEALHAGFVKRDPALGALDVIASASLAIGDDIEDLRRIGGADGYRNKTR
jgi:hypothetical protein